MLWHIAQSTQKYFFVPLKWSKVDDYDDEWRVLMQPATFIQLWFYLSGRWKQKKKNEKNEFYALFVDAIFVAHLFNVLLLSIFAWYFVWNEIFFWLQRGRLLICHQNISFSIIYITSQCNEMSQVFMKWDVCCCHF
jgi:hypothetical protein